MGGADIRSGVALTRGTDNGTFDSDRARRAVMDDGRFGAKAAAEIAEAIERVETRDALMLYGEC